MSAVKLLEGDLREPIAGHLTYAAGVRPNPRIPMGPNTIGELLWPVTVEDLDDGWRRFTNGVWVSPEGTPITAPKPKGAHTRVGFAYAAPPEVAP